MNEWSREGKLFRERQSKRQAILWASLSWVDMFQQRRESLVCRGLAKMRLLQGSPTPGSIWECGSPLLNLNSSGDIFQTGYLQHIVNQRWGQIKRLFHLPLEKCFPAWCESIRINWEYLFTKLHMLILHPQNLRDQNLWGGGQSSASHWEKLSRI